MAVEIALQGFTLNFTSKCYEYALQQTINYMIRDSKSTGCLLEEGTYLYSALQIAVGTEYECVVGILLSGKLSSIVYFMTSPRDD